MTMQICLIPASRASCTTWCIIGRFPTNSISFGAPLVSGHIRVPRPAAGITAFVNLCDVGIVRTSGLPQKPRISALDSLFDSGSFVHCKSSTERNRALRGSGPNPSHAFEDALTLAGSPDPRNDRVCITSLCPRQFLVTSACRQLRRRQQGVSSARQSYYAIVDKLETPDPATVVFRLKFATGAFLPALADPFTWIYKKAILDKDPHWYEKNIMGSGPFKL